MIFVLYGVHENRQAYLKSENTILDYGYREKFMIIFLFFSFNSIKSIPFSRLEKVFEEPEGGQ